MEVYGIVNDPKTIASLYQTRTKQAEENCKLASKQIKEALKANGLGDVPVNKFNSRRIECKVFLNHEKRERVMKVIEKTFQKTQRSELPGGIDIWFNGKQINISVV